MSRETLVHCDEAGCSEWETTAPRAGRTTAQQRRRREQFGWKRIEGFDFCPAHSDLVANDPELEDDRG